LRAARHEDPIRPNLVRSKNDGLCLNPVSEKMVQALFLDHIDPASERVLEVGDQSAGEERGGIGSGFDQEVQIAVGPRFATDKRTKDLHAGYAMAMCNRHNPIPVPRL
jgi:hypothetical protein